MVGRVRGGQILGGGEVGARAVSGVSGVVITVFGLQALCPRPPPRLQPLHVRHLLPQEQNPLFLQRGLDLRQSYQGPRHLQVSRHLQTQ